MTSKQDNRSDVERAQQQHDEAVKAVADHRAEVQQVEQQVAGFGSVVPTEAVYTKAMQRREYLAQLAPAVERAERDALGQLRRAQQVQVLEAFADLNVQDWTEGTDAKAATAREALAEVVKAGATFNARRAQSIKALAEVGLKVGEADPFAAAMVGSSRVGGPADVLYIGGETVQAVSIGAELARLCNQVLAEVGSVQRVEVAK